MRTSLTASTLCLLAVAALVLGGCGLKGDLYLTEADPAAGQDAGDPDDRDESDREN